MSPIQERIEKAFERYPQAHALFFFDPEGHHKEAIAEVVPSGYILHQVGECFFSAKSRLAREWKSERVLLYCEIARPKSQEEKHAFPLLGELIAGRALELDEVGDFLEKYGLAESTRPTVAKWISELRLKLVQETCSDVLAKGVFDEPELIRGLVAAFLELRRVEEYGVIAARMLVVFCSERDKRWTGFRRKLEGLDLTGYVAECVSSATGLPLENLDDAAVRRWAEAIQYNRIVSGLETSDFDMYKQLKVASYEQETRFRQFLQQVERHPLAERFVAALDELGKNIRGETLLTVYGSTAQFGAMPPAMFWELTRRMLAASLANPSEALQHLGKQKVTPKEGTSARKVLEFLTMGAEFLAFLPGQKAEYTLNSVTEYTERYTEEWYKLDLLYRKSLHAYKSVDVGEVPDEVVEAARELADCIMVRYDSHVDEMNREWLKCLAEQNFDYNRLGIPLQSSFYADHVQDSATKVAVIISDAFRFEAARELLGVLHQDSKNTATLGYCLASIPSRTSVGMALLLPGPKRWADPDILAYDHATSSKSRGKVLREALPNSAAVQAKDLDGMPKEEQREVFKREVVYVYHDIVDSISDKRATEHLTFQSVKAAIEDLDRLVRLLHGSLNVRRVIVTADHGFLYTERELSDADLERIPVDETIESHNRFFLTAERVDLPLLYSFPYATTTGIDAPLWVNIPVATNRYKVQGAGHRFVHCGGSLQELIVPVLESTRKREEVIERVQVSLMAPKSLKVVSSRIHVDVFQVESVGQLKKSRTIEVGLYHPTRGDLLSNRETLVLDSTDERPTERISGVDLTLGVNSGNLPTLKLRIYDREDPLNPLEDILITNHTLIEPDF